MLIQWPQIVLRLECTSCKAKKQLPLKRTKHFELGYVLLPTPAHRNLLAELTSSPVVTRRQRVRLWSFKWKALVTSWHFVFVLAHIAFFARRLPTTIHQSRSANGPKNKTDTKKKFDTAHGEHRLISARLPLAISLTQPAS